MKLARLGSFHRTRLSFMPVLLRRVEREAWRFGRTAWEIDKAGVGRAVYTVTGPERSYSLVCFAHDLPDHLRSDRVIATAWDATFALFDGIPDEDDLARLAANVPKQEAGRVTDRELTLSRANRSVRLFEEVVAELAAGRQPDAGRIDEVGYLMRTTAVYGSGKFGAADRAMIRDRPELRGPFQAEMLTVWLIRAFVLDLVEHIAAARGGESAVTMEPDLRRRFGIGNSTGLGMAPFLMNHPVLLNNWMLALETALQRVRSVESATPGEVDTFRSSLAAARRNADTWHSDHPLQQQKIADLRTDLAALDDWASAAGFPDAAGPWDRLWRWAESALGLEGQEAVVSLLLDTRPDLVDGLSDCIDADEDAAFAIDGAMDLDDLRRLLAAEYGWADVIDPDDRDHCARFWYVSEEKLEPRLGERHGEPGAELELPLATGRDINTLATALDELSPEQGGTVADFLLAAPRFRHVVRRVQISARHPYAEIRDNLVAADMLPIDLLRCKLSFFGASHFDPRSDRWVRICMYQDAPFPNEILAPR